MNGRTFGLNGPTNPLLQLVYLVAAGLLFIAAFVMGAVVLVFIFGLALIFSLVVWIRLWWARRKIARGGGAPGGRPGPGSGDSGRIIDAEYSVVEDRDHRDVRG